MRKMHRTPAAGGGETFSGVVPIHRGPFCTENSNGFFLANSWHWYVMFPWTKTHYDEIVQEQHRYGRFRLCIGPLRLHLGFKPRDVGIFISGWFRPGGQRIMKE